MDTQHMELPLNTQHNAYIYLHHFFPVSIILSNGYFRPWYYQNFTNLFAFAKTSSMNDYIFFDFCPPSYWDVISQSYFSLSLLKEVKNILHFIKERLQEKQYVSIDLDEYYLPMKHAYQCYRFIHPMLIYGYDDEKKELLCIGSGKQDTYDAGIGFLGKYKISYDTFEKAYTSMLDLASSMPAFPFTFGEPIALFRLKGWSPTDISSEHQENNVDAYHSLFAIKHFINDLCYYIQGKHDNRLPFEMHYKLNTLQESTLTYGTDVLDKIVDYLSFHLLERKETIPYPFIHLIFEHKKSIYERLIVLSETLCPNEKMTEFINEYKKIMNFANGIRFKYLSYHQRRLIKDAIELVDKIKILKGKEMSLLGDMYAYLNTQMKEGDLTLRP